jgi:hypothetical protein
LLIRYVWTVMRQLLPWFLKTITITIPDLK